MEIHLKPELEAAIERNVASGRYASPEEYLSEAIESLEEREETLDGIRGKLEHSWQQGECGELISLDDFRAEMKAYKADWIKQHRSA
jgi:putative addiction module CopG family antidote